MLTEIRFIETLLHKKIYLIFQLCSEVAYFKSVLSWLNPTSKRMKLNRY